MYIVHEAFKVTGVIGYKFFFVKTIEKVIRLFTVLIFFSGGCEDRPILWAFFTNFSLETIYLSPDLREKWLYLQN